MPKPRSGARDIERYAGLFARRTQVMKSSAMRDLMAVTARPEVISLAGGLPDTSTFPAEDFTALMTRVGVDDAARALQYGPTEGLDEVKGPIAEVMAAEGMEVESGDLLVTTGGQQVIELVCKTLIDPGDVIIAEAPTYPGAVPVFVSYQADVVQIEMDEDGMRIDVLEAELERLDASGRVPKFIYTVPSFQNPAGVTMSLERRRRLVEIARRRELLVLEDNPYGMLRYEGSPLADALLARRRRVRDLPRDVLEDPLPGAAAGLDGRAAAGARQAQPGEGRGGPLLLAAVAAVRADLLRRARLARLRAVADGALPAAAGHHARGAGRALPARGDLDAAAGRALHLGAAARLHRHHGPARAGAPRPRGVRARPRGLPGRPRRLGDAAELLRRRRRRHPRGDPPDRQGRARAGRAVRHAHRRRARVRARRRAAGRLGGARRRAAATPGAPRIVPLRRRAG